MTKQDITVDEDYKIKLPEQDYLVALVTGIIFVTGGLLQLILSSKHSGTDIEDIVIGLFFLIPGILGLIFGVYNLVKLLINNRQETKQLLRKKYNIK